MASDSSQPVKSDPKDRRRWQTPKLTEYGHIGKLTQGNSGAKPEPTGRRR
jgi:hypothetical protein